jgi:uncharacterized protein (TIGR02145 family)
MKRLITFLLLSTILMPVMAQVPLSFSYQAVVRGSDGNVLSGQNVGVEISIVPEGTYSMPVYTETHSVTTNQFGLFSVMVGEGTPVKGEFSSIEWWSGEFFLQTAIDTSGGTNYVTMGSTQLVSVPFALYSQGLILTDENGQSHLVTVDADGNLSTNEVFVKCGDNFTDPRDGKVYNTVQIGNQCWMARNLEYGQFIFSSESQSDNGVVEIYCYSDNSFACQFGGGLYTWDEMMQYSTDSINQGVCPEGWRIPTDYEWKLLEGIADSQYGVGDAVWNQTGWRGTDAGGNLKSNEVNRWNAPNTGATDKFGMNIVGAGLFDGSSFSGAAENTFIFTSVETGSGAFVRRFDYDKATSYRGDIPKTYAASVRCISNREFPNLPPSMPSDPNPVNGADEQSNSTVLSWQCSDPENEVLTYDIFFDTINPPAQIATGQSGTSYDPGELQPGNIYYWKIIAHDYLNQTDGPVWNFTTTTNLPPEKPYNPVPADGVGDIDPLNTVLYWSCSDPNNDQLVFDFYFGENNPPEPFMYDVQDTSIDISGMMQVGTIYYWKIVAKDGMNETEGDIWSFATLTNAPPATPSNPNPPDNQGMPWGSGIISWSCSDPDNDTLTYDVYFGEMAEELDLIAGGISDTSYMLDNLLYYHPYYWKIVVHDPYFDVYGPIWTFTTALPPVGTPENPLPADGATNVSIYTDIEWDCTVYADEYEFDINFGTSSIPVLYDHIQGNGDHTVYSPGSLTPGMTYYWQIEVNDYYGFGNTGPIWSFTTSSDNPPGTPHNPQPVNEQYNVPQNDTLFWSCNDPDNDPLVFDVYFGVDTMNLSIVSASQSDTFYIFSSVQNGTRYYWKIVAKDAEYGTAGPIWAFVTGNNTAPNPPSNPIPEDNALNQKVTLDLKWQCSDDDGNPLEYILFLGTSNPPPFYTDNLTDTVYEIWNLDKGTQYYWKVEAFDLYDYTSSPVWTFTTSSDNPPYQAFNPQPENEGSDQPLNAVLSWTGADPDNDPLTFDVYLGTNYLNMTLVSQGQSETSYDPGLLDYSTQYIWSITTSDGLYSTEGEYWSFYTVDNYPPDLPSNPIPSNQETNVSTSVTLSWTCSDPNNDPLLYDVYIGTDSENMTLVSSGQSSTSYNPGTLNNSTQYYWKIVVSDGDVTTEGEIWVFTTED